MEIYGSSEYVKFLMEEETSGSTTTTYLGYASYDGANAYTTAGDTAKPIWKIRKIVSDNSAGTTETFYAEGSSAFKFKWTDRTTLTYL